MLPTWAVLVRSSWLVADSKGGSTCKSNGHVLRQEQRETGWGLMQAFMAILSHTNYLQAGHGGTHL